MFGLTARMYAIVMNVVTPAMISVLTVVPFSRSLNVFSISLLNFSIIFSPFEFCRRKCRLIIWKHPKCYNIIK